MDAAEAKDKKAVWFKKFYKKPERKIADHEQFKTIPVDKTGFSIHFLFDVEKQYDKKTDFV